MTKPIDLGTVVDAFEMQSKECRSILDRQTGEIHLLTSEEIYAIDDAEDLESFSDWQRPLIEIGRLAFNDTTGRFLTLPDQFEIHEYRALEGFSTSQADPDVSDQLLSAIRGRGAFRMFKATVDRLGLRDEWFKYRDEFLLRIARDWCEDHDLPFEEAL
jgi:hypothetical protein